MLQRHDRDRAHRRTHAAKYLSNLMRALEPTAPGAVGAPLASQMARNLRLYGAAQSGFIESEQVETEWRLSEWEPLLPMLTELTQGRFCSHMPLVQAWEGVCRRVEGFEIGTDTPTPGGKRLRAALAVAHRVRRSQRAWLIVFYLSGGSHVARLSRDVAHLVASSCLLPAHHEPSGEAGGNAG
jgi:hypothetical protein